MQLLFANNTGKADFVSAFFTFIRKEFYEIIIDCSYLLFKMKTITKNKQKIHINIAEKQKNKNNIQLVIIF